MNRIPLAIGPRSAPDLPAAANLTRVRIVNLIEAVVARLDKTAEVFQFGDKALLASRMQAASAQKALTKGQTRTL